MQCYVPQVLNMLEAMPPSLMNDACGACLNSSILEHMLSMSMSGLLRASIMSLLD